MTARLDRFWFPLRLAVAVSLTALAVGPGYAETVTAALNGSRTSLLAVLPLLVVAIASGYRSAPRGVADTESNWIIAALVAIPALAGLWLLGQRMPTLAALWHLHNFGGVVIFAAALSVLFGVRHVARMWPLWVFAICCVSPLPLVLVSAAFGGSDAAAAVPAALAGTVAVALASPMAGWWRRLVAAATCAAVSTVVIVAAAAHLPLAVTTLLVGGVFPVTAIVCCRRTPAGVGSWTAPHALSVRTVGVLAAMAAALAVLAPNAGAPTGPLPAVDIDWADRAGLTSPVSYDFMTRYAGPDVELVRYRVATTPLRPAIAVDVMTAADRTALTEAADLMWYPAARPAEYRPAPADSGLPAGALMAHTNADTARVGGRDDWLAITWQWRAGEVFQQVTVLSNQSLNSARSLPAPKPVTLFDASVRPALWVARQQPDSSGVVDPVVLQHATSLAAGLRQAAAPEPVSGTAPDA
ncbi:hypothetical protein E4P42_09410 [Mycobacterium sp. PS03-16]|uniref:hypothetical protein n=1 Tax=Mycobacterium sp. PS03-16 TaxID=2559611 RepID=UPI00107343E9|nr:hypothetical protein [Mycobacterium sp. PS03-16]TFV59163.1 hypothetical protein E4P42_09410 [Mycobacterium sp. PS03-16]